MPLGDSLTACFVDRCDGGESLCSAPAFRVFEVDAREGRRPFVAVISQPAVLEFTAEFDRDDDGRRIVQARVANSSSVMRGRRSPSSLNIGF